MTLKMLLKGLFNWMVANHKIGELFCGEIVISFHNGVVNRKYKIVKHENINEEK
jgi:hypothetical protein